MTAYNPVIQMTQEIATAPENYALTVAITGLTDNSQVPRKLYEGIENMTVKQLEQTFGAKSQITSLLKDALTCTDECGYYKPKIFAIPYQEGSGSGFVSHVRKIDITGTAVADQVITMTINKLNPSRIEVQQAVGIAARYTANTECGSFTSNDISTGKPSNASNGIVAPLNFVNTNDITIKLTIKKGETAEEVALKISNALTNSSTCPFIPELAGTVATPEVLTVVNLEYIHKGALGNTCGFEIATTGTGLSFSVEEVTAGTGYIDASDILNTPTNDEFVFGERDIHIMPLSADVFSEEDRALLLVDRNEKRQNIKGNTPLDGILITCLAFNTQLEEFDNEGNRIDGSVEKYHNDNPLTEEGLCLHNLVLEKGTRPGEYNYVVSQSSIEKLDALQMSAVVKRKDKVISIQHAYTRSDNSTVKYLNTFFQMSFFRRLVIEVSVVKTFGNGENSYTEGGINHTGKISAAYIINDFLDIYEYFIGAKTAVRGSTYDDNAELASKVALHIGMLNDDESAKKKYKLIVNDSFAYQKPTKTIVLSVLQDLVYAVVGVNITQVVQ